MKITIKQDESVTETEVTIVCRTLDRELEEMIANMTISEGTLTGTKEGENFFIPLTDILYFETVDRKVFFYTNEDSYETYTTISKLEEKLANTYFARISKSVIANLKKVKSINQEENSRLRATLISGEKVIVSRQYIGDIKRKLGGEIK